MQINVSENNGIRTKHEDNKAQLAAQFLIACERLFSSTQQYDEEMIKPGRCTNLDIRFPQLTSELKRNE